MRAEYIQGAPISALERCLHAKNDDIVLVNPADGTPDTFIRKI